MNKNTTIKKLQMGRERLIKIKNYAFVNFIFIYIYIYIYILLQQFINQIYKNILTKII